MGQTAKQAGITDGWKIETVRPNSHIIRLDVKPGWEQWIMLSSDRHHDNAQTRQDLERAHLEKAKARNAIILDFGDAFCAMQGKYDPRSNMADVRPEHKRDDYLDALLETATDFYAPYAPYFALISRGNHETNIRNRHGIDLTSALVDRLRQRGSRAVTGEYSGWVLFRFHIRNITTTRKLHYHHGSGGGGPVTRGTIATNRAAVNWPDANILVSGHTHDQWTLPIRREGCRENGIPYSDLAWHIRTPSYKDEHERGSGWAVERGHNPKPLGCVWLRFSAGRADLAEINMSVEADVC